MKQLDENTGADSLISVIIPVYNCQDYIGRCIESVLNQSYGNIEVIIINDGSTDNSAKLCRDYAHRDSRIKVIDSQNYGPSKARNTGIENSKGSFIFFMDADDFIEQKALELLMGSYNRYSADLVVGDFKKVQNGKVESGHARVFLADKLLSKQDIVDYTRSYLKKPNRFPLFVYSWGRLFKAAIIKENKLFYDVNLRTFEDVAFNFDYLKHAKDLFFLNVPLYNHLISDNYASAAMSLGADPEDLFGYRKALAEAADFLDSCSSGGDTEKEIAHAYVCYTIIQLIRCCGQINKNNKKKIYAFISKFVNEPKLRQSLPFYFPSKGDSRIIPILIKLKLIYPLILVCRYKANKRYGNRKGRPLK